MAGNKKEFNRDMFIHDAKEIFPEYEYSKIENVSKKTQPVTIFCPKHGVFKRNYNTLVKEQNGCPKCRTRVKWNTEQIKKIVNEIHNGKYNVSKVVYTGYKNKFTLVCPEHGDFLLDIEHLQRRQGCPKCRYDKSRESNTRTIDLVLNEAKNVHGDKYDYSLITEYKSDRIKYPIICHEKGKDGNEHGIFLQTMNNHIKGKQGCPICGKFKSAEHRKLTFEEIIKRAKQAHPLENYIYHQESYNGVENKMVITCPIHGDFQQKVSNHIQLGQGCPECKKTALEREVELLLKDNNFEYIYEYRAQWLGIQSLDYYLPDYKIAIECQGIQHFEATNFNGKNNEIEMQKKLENVIKLDETKKEKCKKNNVKILYYANYEYDFPYSVITDKEELLTKILQNNDKN